MEKKRVFHRQSPSITLSNLGICAMALICRFICMMVDVTMSMDVNPTQIPVVRRMCASA